MSSSKILPMLNLASAIANARDIADVKKTSSMYSVSDAFSTYSERLFNFVRSKVGVIEEAEDIVQDVFYQLVRMDNLAKPVEQTMAWLYKTATNRIIDKGRKKKEEQLPTHYDEDEEDYIYDEIADIAFGEESTPETEYLRSIVLDEINAALAELPPEQREVFEQSEILGMSVKEISETTNTPINTILSRKHYAVLALRKQLKELYEEITT
ncbi:RNA polymerase subunit sigma-24 [Fibrobacterales bacterium]|nr:RNA polymerase subunit sigma-24 [Fibrobacterales bacterium]